jgi:hypothetical protein
MSFIQQAEQIQLHRQQHRRELPLNRDFSCLVCYPLTNQLPSEQFQNFWLWLLNYYEPATYSAYTVNAFPVFLHLFRSEIPTGDSNPTHINISVKTTTYLIKLVYSIRFETNLSSIHSFVFRIYQLTYRTNFFEEPVTSDLYFFDNTPPLFPTLPLYTNEEEPEDFYIDKLFVEPEPTPLVPIVDLNEDFYLDLLFGDNNMANQPPPPLVLTNNGADALTGNNALAIFNDIFGDHDNRFKGILTAMQAQQQAQNQGEKFTAKVSDFSGLDHEDPVDWFNSFERAAITNR